jgi:hypothetical protein
MGLEKDYDIIFMPNKFWKGTNRFQELLLEFSIILILYLFLWASGIVYIIGENHKKIGLYGIVGHYFFLNLLYFIYKIHRTFYIVNKVGISYRKKVLSIDYSYLYFFNKSISIDLICFFYKIKFGASFRTDFTSVTIYNKSQKVCKLVSNQNGWKENIVKKMISEFDNIVKNNNYVR